MIKSIKNFLIIFLIVFSRFNRKYLKLTNVDITRFAIKLFTCRWWWMDTKQRLNRNQSSRPLCSLFLLLLYKHIAIILSFSLFLSFSHCPSLSLILSFFPPLSISVALFLLFFSLYRYFTFFLTFSLFISVLLFLFLSPSFFFCCSLCFVSSLSGYYTFSLFISVLLSLFLTLFFCLCLSISVALFLFLYPSFCVWHALFPINKY